MGGSVMEFDGFWILNLTSGRWTEQNKEKGVKIVDTGSDEAVGEERGGVFSVGRMDTVNVGENMRGG